MSALLTFFGWWCIASATVCSGYTVALIGRAALLAVDLLFGLAGIGLLFLLLARILA